MSEPEREEEVRGPTIRDKRRIDPKTYQVREPQPAAAPAGPEPAAAPNQPGSQTEPGHQGDEVTELKAALAERTGDLQRLQAEYINYKRRVDRDRDNARRHTIEGVLRDFLPTFDDVRSAREHGEVTGAFKAVADEIERLSTKYGLTSYGEKGDLFDPHIHEALLHQGEVEGLTGPTCIEILQPGYRAGDTILRPARVAVADPAPEATSAEEPLTQPGPAADIPSAPDETGADVETGTDAEVGTDAETGTDQG